MDWDYARLIEEDVLELNKCFVELFGLEKNFDSWPKARVGEIYGAIDIPLIAPANGRPEDVRTGFQLEEVAIEIVLIAAAPSRVEASSLGAGMAIRLKDGIKKIQAFAATNLKILDNLSVKGEIPIKKDQTQTTPRQWLVQVAASGNATIALYKNMQGELASPPKYDRKANYEVNPRILQALVRINKEDASNS